MTLHLQNEAARTIQRILVRERDPITFRPIRTLFRLWNPPQFTTYDAANLMAYMNASGDTSDPLTRRKLHRHELMRLARLAGVPFECESIDERLRRQRMQSLQNRLFLQEHSSSHELLRLLCTLRSMSTEEEWQDIVRMTNLTTFRVRTVVQVRGNTRRTVYLPPRVV